eukprot:gnl/MRDRNA2_/MRDRNA2_84364_c0_seq1.p1 gnl/MRDRNA2_/MRDRNA2_84364_c0~~gnl/MRDRNA2_/MRDRNA2_84364_c0_seq1.p1  ORF type:complete len:706 (-),score=135.35 gnl/MRDRNA2_/MRDRNA2_84364_c0_seq1:161-2278(-)
MPGCCPCKKYESPNAKIRMGSGCFCCTLGWCFSLTAFLLLAPAISMLGDNTYDLMFIDNTHETDYSGLAGDMTAESEQFKAWSKSMEESFEDCKKEGNKASQCINGFDVRIAVFNVTNAVAVVHAGDLPYVQERGPIYLKMYSDKKDIDKKLWDETGVVKYRVETTYKLDEEKCDQPCLDLLEEKIVVPNPVWAQLNANGADMVFAAIVLVGGLAQRGVMPAAAFDLNEQEAAAFTQIFLLEKDPIKQLGLVGLFMQTAYETATKAGAGDLSGTCQLGGLELDAMRCATIIQKVVGAIPAAWAGAMQMFGPMYGTGAAAPIFIERPVKEVLGFNGSTFTDPMTKMGGLSFAAAHDKKPPQSDPEGLFRYAQMSSKFGSEGTHYNIKYMEAENDCRYDKDCKMTSAALDSCTPSETCTPSTFRGYMGTNFPGHIWRNSSYGSKKGFDDLRIGTIFNGFKNGRGTKLAVVDKSNVLVPSRNVPAQLLNQWRPDGMLQFFELTLKSFGDRLENCDGKEPGSPGYDCSSPLYAVTVAPGLGGVPLYLTNPYFDNRVLTSFKEEHQKALKTAAYNPISRVAISRCSGNSWCDDHSYGKHNTSLWVEPNWGLTFRVQSSLQMNARIGVTPSKLYPKVNDALIPVYWVSETLEPPEQYKEKLYDFQDSVVQLHAWFCLLAISGSVYILVGSMCCFSICHLEKKYQQKRLLGN